MPQTAVTQKLQPEPAEFRLDTHPEVSLDFRRVQEQLARGYDRPFLLIDSAIVRTKARRFMAAMPRVRPHYAVKANPTPEVLSVLREEGVGFEIASTAELDLLMSLGVAAHEIIYSNPVKASAYVRYAAQQGVKWYAIDSVEELDKIFAIAPEAKLILRIDVPNGGSDWPLSGKFGAQQAEISHIIREAARQGADLAGVTFHVGSQCLNAENWRVAIERAKRVFAEMKLAGLAPQLLNIGGGYPVRLTKPMPSIEAIADVVNEALADIPEHVRVVAEPGRYLVSDAGYFVCRVIGTATRGGKRWMYWDSGTFGGMVEATDGLHYIVETDRKGALTPWHVGGPTCDSVDVMMKDESLPGDLREGDFIYLKNAGAYTSAYASTFNGFPLPEVIVLSSVK
jgi:ornithine decarboxylase